MVRDLANIGKNISTAKAMIWSCVKNALIGNIDPGRIITGNWLKMLKMDEEGKFNCQKFMNSVKTIREDRLKKIFYKRLFQISSEAFQ